MQVHLVAVEVGVVRGADALVEPVVSHKNFFLFAGLEPSAYE